VSQIKAVQKQERYSFNTALARVKEDGRPDSYFTVSLPKNGWIVSGLRIVAKTGRMELLDGKTQTSAIEFTKQLSRRKVTGSYNVAMKTIDLLHKAILNSKADTADQLIAQIHALGKTLINAAPQELAVGNAVRRVLATIYTESSHSIHERKSEAAEPGMPEDVELHTTRLTVEQDRSLHKLLDAGNEHVARTQVSESTDREGPMGDASARQKLRSTRVADIKSAVLGEIEELVDDLSSVNIHVADQALEHIHANEVILTFGKSSTVSQFLVEAAKIRAFQVIVAESAPSFCGQTMALDLSKQGVDTTLITDAAVFAMMARANKVIVGTHAVLANGGILAHAGAYNLAVAASHYSVPFVVVTGLYKLCPVFAFNQDTINDQNPPSDVIGFDEGCLPGLEVENPAYEYIPPQYVTLFVTNE
jgi:translation initiation factor eIF-2B subunit beta